MVAPSLGADVATFETSAEARARLSQNRKWFIVAADVEFDVYHKESCLRMSLAERAWAWVARGSLRLFTQVAWCLE